MVARTALAVSFRVRPTLRFPVATLELVAFGVSQLVPVSLAPSFLLILSSFAWVFLPLLKV